MQSIKPVISCGAVVYKKNNGKTYILLVKQANNSVGWGIPKGHKESGESYVQTAKREVKEETGLDIHILTRLPHVMIEKKSYRKVVIPYLAIQIDNSLPSCDHKMSEVVDVKWFDIDLLPIIHPYQKPIIDAAMLIIGGFVGE